MCERLRTRGTREERGREGEKEKREEREREYYWGNCWVFKGREGVGRQGAREAC